MLFHFLCLIEWWFGKNFWGQPQNLWFIKILVVTSATPDKKTNSWISIITSRGCFNGTIRFNIKSCRNDTLTPYLVVRPKTWFYQKQRVFPHFENSRRTHLWISADDFSLKSIYGPWDLWWKWFELIIWRTSVHTGNHSKKHAIHFLLGSLNTVADNYSSTK